MTIRGKLAAALVATVATTAAMAAALYFGASSGRAVVEGDGLLHREARVLERIETLARELGPAPAAVDRDRLRALAVEGRERLAELEAIRARQSVAIRRILPGYRSALVDVNPRLGAWLAEVEAAAREPAPVGAGELVRLATSFDRTVRPALADAEALRPGFESAMRAEADRGTAIGQQLAVWFPLVVLALVGILGVSLFAPLDRRLRRLASAARRIGAGDLEVSLPARGDDEVAAVERAFNSMTRDLGRGIAERERLIRERAEGEDQVLRAYNARLEAAVEARTAAAAAANRELKQRFEELLATRGRLVVADRLATIGQLAAGIGHEINNPLAYVAANLAFVDAELARPPAEWDGPAVAELRSAVQEAREGAARIQAIVRDLKTVARTTPGDLRPVDLAESLRAAVKLSAHQVRHHARLDEDYAPGCRVLADEGKLTQVFLNLLVNAAQALPEDRAGENAIRVAVRTGTGGQVVAEIEDNGRGIPVEHLERIFEPFFTTKPVGKGTGLGLSVCQGIVVGLGGAITVRSEVGRGTVFRVSLPAADGEGDAPAEAAPAGETAAPAARRRVLVVDDEREIGAAILRVVGREADVHVVGGGAEALCHFEHEGFPDVVLCDLVMPGMTGMELQVQVARRWPGQERRFVFMTGDVSSEHARRFIEATSNPWLEKPFDLARLRALVLAPAVPAT